MIKQPFIIISGYPRSGTTLFRSVLGAHSEIHLENEPELFRSFYLLNLDNTSRISVNSFIEYLNSDKKKYNMTIKYLQEKNLENINLDIEYTLRDFYNLLINSADKGVSGEKSLNNVFFKRYIDNIVDNLHIVLIRNPLPTIESVIKKRYSHLSKAELKDRVLKASVSWSIYYLIVKHLSDTKNKVYLVKYEEFIQNSKKELILILDEFNLSYEDFMLSPEARKNDVVLSNQTHSYFHQNLVNDIDSNKIHVKTELSQDLIDIICSVTSPVAKVFGYDLPKPTQRIKLLTQIKYIWKLRYKYRSYGLNIYKIFYLYLNNYFAHFYN